MEMDKNNKYNRISPFLLIAALALFMAFCLDMTGETLRRPAYFFALIAFILLAIVFRQSLPKAKVIWVMVAGALVKAAYILYTAIWTRQHDVISFGAGEGHAAYIEYFLVFKSLPDFDPRSVWAFFQPPLHHIISAIWMWINIRLGIAERQLQESVQVLSLSYMLVLMVLVYFICKELELTERATLIVMAISSFHPIFILLSGSINNDALSICLSGLAFYLAICWYKRPTILNILLLALCIGLSMMAKLSSALIAPGIGAMMLYKLYEGRDNIKKYILEFFLFGIVVFPIGLWWPIRNKILWDMPFNYIPEVGEQLTHSSLFSRLFDIRLSSPYASLINNGAEYDEYNVFLALIKTSLFGEADFSMVSRWITPFAWLLFVSFIVIALLEIIALVKVCISRKDGLEIQYKILFGVTCISILAGYLSFALSYNNFSAQDFRYGALMCALMAVLLGIYSDRLKNGVMLKLIYVSSGLFAFSSAAVYLLAGLL